MNYILKAIGVSNKRKKADLSEDFVKRLESTELDMKFWADTCKVWFNNMPKAMSIGDILIIYVVKGEKRNGGKFGGRIMGYCEVLSDICKGIVENGQFAKYVIVKNLCKSFSEKSKHENTELINIEQFNIEFKGTPIQSGYAKLDCSKAKEIICEIKKHK